MESSRNIEAWTDGSCNNSNGLGAWAYVLRYGPHEKSYGEPLSDTTSQRCELVAAIEALNALTRDSTVSIYTDSQYLIDGARSLHHTGWPLSKFHKANKDLWLLLSTAMKRHVVKFCKVKAHSGVDLNEVVDRMANQARLQRTEDGSEAKGVVHSLDETREAGRRPPRVSESICWPVESTENYLRFGREVTLLYPFVQHGKEEVPKVMTPLGPGTLKQALSDAVIVALDNPVRFLYSKSGKTSPAAEEFDVGEVWPYDEGVEREIGDESGNGCSLSRLRGDRQDKKQDGADRDSDKSSAADGRPGQRSDAQREDEEAGGEREASEGKAELSLF